VGKGDPCQLVWQVNKIDGYGPRHSESKIGVGRAGSPAPPPSEPDGRVSRIRLSG